MKITRCTALLFVLTAGMLFAQDPVIQGKVYHANSLDALSGVNIFVRGTGIGTSTYLDGSFRLPIQDAPEDAVVIFDHISFYPLEISLREALRLEKFYLKPQVIQLPAVSVIGEKQPPTLLKDIPQAYTVVEAKFFEGRGYSDLGDILKAEQSVQVEENASGTKTVAIRGGNPDDVIVLYDGIKLNSSSNHIFDFSLINLEDVQQVEIVRGGNSALYGAGAFSGIINIKPKTFRDYTIKVQNRLGTYTTADYNLQLHRNILKKFDIAYSYRQGKTKREFLDETGFDHYALDNENRYHTASLTYNFQNTWNDDSEKHLRVLYFRSDLDFRNNQYMQNILDMNQIVSLRFVGDIWKFRNLNLTAAYRWLDTDWDTTSDVNAYDLRFRNRALSLNLEKRFFTLGGFELITSYQFERGELDYADDTPYGQSPEGFRSALLTRMKHGGVGVLKLHIPSVSDFIEASDFNLSVRYEQAENRFSEVVPHESDSGNTDPADPDEGDWKEAMFNFSSFVAGKNDRFGLNAHLNFGKNFKFPTMMQQIGNPFEIDTFFRVYEPNLFPEWSNHYEIGFDLVTEVSQALTINGWEAGFNLFTTRYTNKIRTYSALFSPITLFDNLAQAAISGFESRLKMFTLQKKLNFEALLSLFSISDKSAFPYKSDAKLILNAFIDHHGYSARLTWFWESEKLAWVRGEKDRLYEQMLPGHANIDIHVSKRFELGRIKLMANVTGLNILGDALEVGGFAIRDSKFYLTLGVQY